MNLDSRLWSSVLLQGGQRRRTNEDSTTQEGRAHLSGEGGSVGGQGSSQGDADAVQSYRAALHSLLAPPRQSHRQTTRVTPPDLRADPCALCRPTEMLPWNPPSSFSAGSDPNTQQQQYRPNYSQEQPQQQPQQQQQGLPQQQQGQPNQQQQQQPAGGPPSYPPMTLASTLHFLQSEHRRYARDRNEWEIERAEMRARIALLEGEKRGNEGALRDLGRRCKMLENALRGER